MTSLEKYGWSNESAGDFTFLPDPQLVLARVVADFGTSLRVATPEIITAELSGKLAHHSSKLLVPKIGDWVQVRLHESGDAIIETVLPRKNEIARRSPGKRTVKQIIATNVDIAFVILSLDNDFSIERLRRFLYQLSASHVRVVIILNKTDKTEDISSYTTQLTSFELPIISMAAIHGAGKEEIYSYIRPAETAILLGSSGVGKSTITNLLLGTNTQRTQETRKSDDAGKHTTVHRELFILPGGGLLIDTPGIRELQLWGSEDILDDSFEDIIRLSSQCKYKSCRHGAEQGCRVREALENESLSRSRFDAYVRMKQELVMLQQKRVARIKREKRRIRPTQSLED